ncbi:MAG: 6-carboxytetrahydropterin synthase [Candidatus Omnitrophica bacterium]|nr:6-carboxytetrahydropterin synthase [Candidatus Omnitrophota bacterium]
MYSVTKTIQFCYGHRLLNYEGKCRDLHGHNGKVEIELSSEALDRRGMVRDFTEIKRAIQGWIDRNLDHKMILCKDDPVLLLLQQQGEPVFAIEANPTAENLAKLIFDEAQRMGFPVTTVRLWETESSCATYAAPRRAAAGRNPERGREAESRDRPTRPRRRIRSISTAA